MKKRLALLLFFMMMFSLVSCNVDNKSNAHLSNTDSANTSTNMLPNENTNDSKDSDVKENTDKSPSSTISLQNELALQSYCAAIRTQIPVYYPLLSSSTPSETYFKNICGQEKGDPTRQALVDMDNDGIKELILDYKSFLILLHFENDLVYATDFPLKSMETIYEDGSFFWSHNDNVFGYECGISRVSFVNGIKKVEELCRAEGDSKYFISGLQVTKKEYYDYVDNTNRTPIKFIPFDTSFLNSNELRAIELVSAHWDIKDGDFDSEYGFRYRIICNGQLICSEDQYSVSLYRFVYNSYYEHYRIAYVNIDTGEILIDEYPGGKG